MDKFGVGAWSVRELDVQQQIVAQQILFKYNLHTIIMLSP
jgi:hypothetical protein